MGRRLFVGGSFCTGPIVWRVQKGNTVLRNRELGLLHPDPETKPQPKIQNQNLSPST